MKNEGDKTRIQNKARKRSRLESKEQQQHIKRTTRDGNMAKQHKETDWVIGDGETEGEKGVYNNREINSNNRDTRRRNMAKQHEEEIDCAIGDNEGRGEEGGKGIYIITKINNI